MHIVLVGDLKRRQGASAGVALMQNGFLSMI